MKYITLYKKCNTVNQDQLLKVLQQYPFDEDQSSYIVYFNSTAKILLAFNGDAISYIYYNKRYVDDDVWYPSTRYSNRGNDFEIRGHENLYPRICEVTSR
jgi:hypothetical protein